MRAEISHCSHLSSIKIIYVKNKIKNLSSTKDWEFRGIAIDCISSIAIVNLRFNMLKFYLTNSVIVPKGVCDI